MIYVINKIFVIVLLLSLGLFYTWALHAMQQQQNKQPQKSIEVSIDEQLIDAAQNHNLELIRDLIKAGANVNHVKHTNINGWYSGDTHTALYAAVNSDFNGNIDKYLEVIELLLQNGADASFEAIRGNWNHCTSYPVFSRIASILTKLKNEDDKIKLIQLMAKNKVDLNQKQYHERSKGWRAYETQTCLLFQVMDMCQIRSKMNDNVKLYSKIDVNKIRQDKQKDLKTKFYKEFPQYQSRRSHQTEEANNQKNTGQIAKPEQQTKLIKLLLSLGVDPDSANSYFYWQNYTNYCEEKDQMMTRLSESRINTYETGLHRAIMNNSIELVKILLEKGAKVFTKCRFTVKIPVYPNEWPEKYREQKVQKNFESLSSYEKQRSNELSKLAEAKNEEDKKKILKNIELYEFQIYKLKLFAIENQCPAQIDEQKQITCLELAKALNVSKQIIELLKIYEQKKSKVTNTLQ